MNSTYNNCNTTSTIVAPDKTPTNINSNNGNLQDKNFREIYRSWKKNLYLFEPFMRSGPFVSLQTYPDFNINYLIDETYIQNLYQDKLNEITNKNLEKTFIIIDTDMSESLEIAYLLNNKFNIKPIINFNFLFHSYGLVGSKDNIERLVVLGENLNTIKPKGYVLFLDYTRYLDFPKELYKRKLNNQYELSLDDLPTSSYLKELGYDNLIIFSKRDASKPSLKGRFKLKEDLEAYIETIKNDINIQITNWG